MKSIEHRAVGDAATGTAMVNIGGESNDEAMWLTFGDVVALSGDFFRPACPPRGNLMGATGGASNACLFRLARVPGHAGAWPGTRDEIICALRVAAVDDAVDDPRFRPGGRFGHLSFSPRADRTDVERAVRDRYLSLAAVNDDHFVAPGTSDASTGSGFPSAPSAYRHLHKVALEEANALGHRRGDLSQAMAREAAAQHYLTDAFASGHLRTPVADIRRYWKGRYPGFWDHLQGRVASTTAASLRELSWALRLVPAAYVRRRTLSELMSRTLGYPELSVGDLVARCLHDWDNAHGLVVDGGHRVFGDGHLEEGATRDLVIDAIRAGNDDIEVAFDLGASRPALGGDALYEAVRLATGATGDDFVAEARIPRPSTANPAQNWRAPDVEGLWESPIVGTSGPTVGDAITSMLEPGGQFIRQLESLGEGLSGSSGLLGLPLVGPWLGGLCCHAFHRGFVEPLSHDPGPLLLDLLQESEPEERQPLSAPMRRLASSRH